MEITIQFIKYFSTGLYFAGPLLVLLLMLIVSLGLVISKLESWSKIDALYFAFITATTVGYGDFRPSKNMSKFISIVISLVGLLLTGIIVALGVKAGSVAFSDVYQHIAVTSH